VSNRLYSDGMFCYVNGMGSGWGWPSFELWWYYDENHNGKFDSGEHMEYAMALNCGTDKDCMGGEYCKKLSAGIPTTYYCQKRCGDGICEAGENCILDSKGPEVCDGTDNNCDGQVDEGIQVVCSSDSSCQPDGCYNGIYRDHRCINSGTCNSLCTYTEKTTDKDGDGHDVECENDCDDSNPLIYRGALEVCDGKDNDCNGITDEVCLPPIVTINYPQQNKIYNKKSIDLKWSANMPLFWSVYSINDLKNISISGNITIDADEGYNQLTICSKSIWKLMGCSSVGFSVDILPPIVSISSPATKIYDKLLNSPIHRSLALCY
jgi:hypothetical protein